MGQRSRKRGRRDKPEPPRARSAASDAGARSSSSKPGAGTTTATPPASQSPRVSRSEQRNEAVRAKLRPIDPGERPWPLTVSAALAALTGVGNLIAYAAGAKVAGKHPAAGGIILFSLLMIVCAVGMWRLRYWAVLGFMGLLAIIVTLFALLLVEASNLLGFVVPIVVIVVAGFLFIKLVRVLSRIQMPKYPGR